ncbi:ABC transporter family substrate-binding protein [Streptomyces sannanensis]|uniref:ABC transporter family substrate-binding protein n=1 Tax=Streptomyces sannanensis TaxID=285536 RepID=A0ABP6SFC5_9ACTN
MSQVGVPRGRVSRTLRSLALLTTGVLTIPVLAALSGCDTKGDAGTAPVAAADVGSASRDLIADGGTLRWAVDAMPQTFNAFQADADATTTRLAGALLPSLFTLDERGRLQRNPDYLESAEIVETEPRQVVLYKLNQQAVWTDGREIGAPDFLAQWRALSGRDSAYWTAHNAGYDRIEKVERGANDLEVRVTFAKPYADWRALFTPLYPKDVTAGPASFNDGARTTLKATAGPFRLTADTREGAVTLIRNPRWWGRPAKLDTLVFQAVPRDQRAAALAAGTVDLAEVDRAAAERIAAARRNGTGTGAVRPTGRDADEQRSLSGYRVRKSLEPAYTQLALNGGSGPLADERVRRAVARALDRKEIAETVLKPLGLPAVPVGSHLALAGQPGYADSSDALGAQDAQKARALLAEAGWTPGGARQKSAGGKAGSKPVTKADDKRQRDEDPNEGLYIINADSKPGDAPSGRLLPDPAPGVAPHGAAVQEQDAVGAGSRHGVAGAYAPMGTAAPAPAAGDKANGPLGKDGKPLMLRFVLPSGPGSESLRAVGDRIIGMLDAVGIGTEIIKVSDDSFFKDHIASGAFDLALYTWPATAFPATDARPIFAKPEPAADGSLLVEQNYSRVGTDRIDQLFDQAVAELDAEEGRKLVKQADARIWAAAGSIPLYQRPQLVAVRQNLANAGAFGFATPAYQDIGYKKRKL